MIVLVLYLGGVILYSNLGLKIKEARKKAGITQKDLAKSLGKSERMVQKYENNEVNPSLEVLSDIVKILGISFDDLWGLGGRIKLENFVKSQRELNGLPPLDEEFSEDELEYDMKRSIAAYLNSYNVDMDTINKTIDIVKMQIKLVLESKNNSK